MNGLHPIIGRSHTARTFCARTAAEAFGTPFIVQRRRPLDVDQIIGAACVLVIVGIAAAWVAGVL